MRRLVVLFSMLSLALTMSTAHSAPISLQKYANCAALSKAFPTGVALNVSAANAAIAAGNERPAVRAKIYTANKKLDRGNTKAICVIKLKQQVPAPVQNLSVGPFVMPTFSPTSTPSLAINWQHPETSGVLYDIFLDGNLVQPDLKFKFAFIRNLAPNTTYTVSVTAKNAAGSSQAVAASATTKSVEESQGLRKIVYSITGTAPSVSVTLQNSTGGTDQFASVTNPQYEFWIRPGVFLYISAQNNADSGDVACSITSDGRRVASSSSSGAYVIATCSGRS